MDLQKLQELGAFVDAAPTPKTIEWQQGGARHKFRVWVVRQPFGVVESAINDLVDRSRGAHLISMSIRLGDDAREQMTYEQAYSLDPALAWAMVMAVNEVNAGKNSLPPTSFGANSSSTESAATPLIEPSVR